jgi:hypothetical protein
MACERFEVAETEHCLKHKGKAVDPMLSLRLANVPHGAKVE